MIFLWLLLSFKYGLGFSLHSTFVSPIQSSHYQILERKHKLKKNKNLSILHISGESTDMSGEKNVPFVVEKLNELTKESFFCLRTKDPRPSSTCTVECKRTDGKPLGWHSDAIDDSLNRRAFVFAREPGKPGTRYDGPLLMHVREIPFSYGKLGGQIWYAAVAFGQYVAMNGSMFKGKKILELGAGLGLPGLIAAKCGGLVTLSEFGYEGEVDGQIIEVPGEKRLIPSALLDNLKYNVLLNSYERIEKDEQVADVRHIDWYDYVDKEHDIDTVNKDDQYDIIIGSDLVNWEDDVGPLIATLKYFLLAKKGSTAIISLSNENRRALPEFLKLIKAEFKTVDVKEQSVIHFEEHPLLLIALSM